MELQYLDEVPHTQVSQEIAELAGKHVGVKIDYRFLPGYTSSATVWAPHNTTSEKVEEFWQEHDRLRLLITQPLREFVLPDDYPLVQGYIYVINGKSQMFIDGERMTVGAWKVLLVSKGTPDAEIKSCDLHGRFSRRPLSKESLPGRYPMIQPKHNRVGQPNRKRRKTYKIRKVQ